MRNTSAFSMVPANVTLTSGLATDFVSSDGRFEVSIPKAAVSDADVTAAGGTMTLSIRQVDPESGSNAGGSGHYSFGRYLIQVLNSSGQTAAQGLRQPVTLILHYGRASGVDLVHSYVLLNAPLPVGSLGADATLPTLGGYSSQPATLDPAAQTLSSTASLTSPSTSISWGTDSPVSVFGRPDPYEASLSGGGLAATYPIEVPPGPGGLTPPLYLGYSSASVSDQHSPQGAAPWVGEGWNLSLGSISWAEHNVAGSGSASWVDSWQLSDAFGTSAELVPSTVTTSTYYDDTPNGITPSPVWWHTVPETHARVFSFTGPNSLPSMPAIPPCFRVYLPNGIMEEFGCTVGSLQYYPQPCAGSPNNTCDYLANWLLDLVTDRKGNQIHINYQSDTESSRGFNYPRDTVLSSVEYDSPSCRNGDTGCTGSAWTPLMRVVFNASHSVLYPYPAGSTCPPIGNLRCDDPADLSGSGNEAAPIVQSTFVLNSAVVQVRASGTASWNTLRSYQLRYSQSAAQQITDPLTGLQESTAGEFILTQFQQFGDDGTTNLPVIGFAYGRQTEFYEDSLRRPIPSSNCGPSWNTGTGGGCFLWSESYAGNSFYLTSVSNGIGEAQGFSWQNARDNMHGVNGAGSNTSNPLYCNNGSVQSSYPCNAADDETWSRIVMSQKNDTVVRIAQAGQGGTQTTTTVTSTTGYAYNISYPLSAQECSDCVAGFSWGNQNDNDYLDFYNGKFLGFANTAVGHPDGSTEWHKFWASEGWGLYDTTQVTCLENPPNPCHNDAWWDFSHTNVGQNNVAHGNEYEVDLYATDAVTLLKQTKFSHAVLCPPTWTTGSPPLSGYGNWNGNLVSELDHGNPVGVCSIDTHQIDAYDYEGITGWDVPHSTSSFAYDYYSRKTNQTTTTNDAGGLGSPTTVVSSPAYIWDDNLRVLSNSVTGVYLVTPNAFVDTEDSSGNHKQCTYTSYDGLGYATSQNTSMVLGEPTTIDRYAGCNTSGAGSDSGTGQIRTTHTYDLKGNQLTTNDPDANALDASHLGCLIGATSYSLCNAFDGTFFILQLSQTNALNQSSSIGYQAPASGTAAGGFGLWPISSTDVNAKVTTFTYDPLGRSTATTLPAETTGLTTTTTSYTVWCSGSAAQTPCAEIDQSRRLNSSTTVTRRTFYDGEGHLVETRSAAPNSQDVVTYSYYDASERLAASSVPYFVTAYTGAPGSAAFSIPDSTQATTVYNYDGLGRQTSITDALQHPFLTSYTVVCGPGSPDSLCYSQTTSTDPLGHQTASLADAWGRTQYVQTFTGSNPYALYGRTKYGYDVVGNLTQIHPNGTTTTTFQFDMAGRQTGIVDPDLGTESYQYDADGNLTQSIDARGASAFAAYDPIDRPKWRNTTNSPPGAYVTYAYDSTANGNAGVGRLTSETFSGAPNNTLSGSETFVYDARGQLTSSTLVVGSTSYPLSNITYNDAGEQLTATYPDGDIVTNAYGAQGWLASVGTQAGTLMSGVGFTGIGGAAGFITGATLAPGSPSAYQYSATYDLLDRPTDLKVSLLQSVLFEQARTFDAAGNVSTANTTLSTGTDHQAFCYDEQNRLTAAASSGTVPCQTFSPGTLTAANYNQSFSYDNMGRLASGPAGAYTYGDPAHVHAATAIGSSYTAAYDLGGNMSCRAPTSSSTCTGTQTGAQLTYNNEGQLSYWKNQPSNPTSSASFLYDGQGKRVAQQTTVGGSTTTTAYIGDFEEDATIGGTTTKTSYYYAGGWRFSLAVNGAVSYLASDGLGSANVTLAANGNVTAAMLYAPYGSVRYVSGTMPTDRGFTGQIADATSGLDYYGARYYDPTAGQFSSADLILPGWGFDPFGLSRYAYVEGNPVAWTDPTGASCVPACHPGGSDAMHFYPAPTGESPLGKCVKDPGCLATAVVSTGVGLAVTGACEAVTGGVATPVCVVAGGEASGLVAGAADCGGDSSYGSCVAVSMVVGGVTAGVTYGALRGFSRWNTSDDMAAPVSSDTEAPPAPSGASEPSIPSSPSIRAPEATNTQPSLPFRDPALRDQVQKVVTHVDEHGAPPPNVYRGGAPGYPVGTYLNKNGRLPSQIVGYYAESDVWPGALGNRGPARLVLGDDGDVYYSPNHYEDFIRIR